MAQYKVIQDIEAEDKLVGPFSLRQFIYAGGAAVCGYLCVVSVTQGVAFLVALWIPPMLFCMFFAWPWSPDQPTEVWALARIRFLFKPRRRIWDQSGQKDLVTITVPKRVEKVYTDGLSRVEVRSRLTALASTIDSRGWALKNANVNTPVLPSFDTAASDRLVAGNSMPQVVSDIDVQASDDIMDEHNNRIAQQFENMIEASSAAHRQKLINEMRAPAAAAPATPPASPTPAAAATTPPADYWFLNQPTGGAALPTQPNNAMFANPALVQPGDYQSTGTVAATPTANEEALGQQLLEQHQVAAQQKNQHLKTINPIGDQPTMQTVADPVAPSVPTAPVAAATPADPAVTAQSDAAILNLASNNDLNVATIARQANKARHPEPPEDEVVVSLR